MIKLIFILLGLAFILYSIFNYLHKKEKGGLQSESHDAKINMKRCDFCDAYVDKQPEFENDVCKICERKRVTTRK